MRINCTEGDEMTNDIPVLYKDKNECCGCTACYAVCPVDAIEMKEDEEGFLYPVIDAEKCVRCHSCERVCPLKETHR